MVELKGSEKQVKWAEDIRGEVLELLEDVNSRVLDKEQVPLKKIMINKSIITDYMNWNPEEPRKKKEYRIATKKIIEDAIEKIKNVEYAAFFITYLAKNRNIFDTKDLFLNSSTKSFKSFSHESLYSLSHISLNSFSVNSTPLFTFTYFIIIYLQKF